MIRKTFTAAALAAAVIAGGTACTVTATNPDEQAVVYNGGPFAETEFQNYVGPGSKLMSDPFDSKFTYPAGQRTVVFADGDEFEAFQAPSKDSVSLKVAGQIRFELTSDPALLQEFHERIGLRLEASTTDGWRKVLSTYMQQTLNRAITEATQGFAWADLYSSPEKKAEWEKKVKSLLTPLIQQTSGGEYFTILDVTLQKPAIPEGLQRSLEAAQIAVKETEAQANRNLQITSEIESIKELVAVLGPDGYNTYQAIKSGKIQVMPIPQGSSVIAGAK